jgi:hypothetical protein
MCFSLATLYFIVMICTLIAMVKFTRKYFKAEALRKKKVGKVLWIYYEGLKTKTIHQTLYNFYYIVRRFLTAVVLVVL